MARVRVTVRVVARVRKDRESTVQLIECDREKVPNIHAILGFQISPWASSASCRKRAGNGSRRGGGVQAPLVLKV